LKLVGKGLRVLDVGCATGYLARQFKANGCYVVGIELNEEMAKVARRYCDEVITGDVEKTEDHLNIDGVFDAIVFGAILEHLRRPDLTLVKFKKYLSPKGYVVASVPNMARFEVRLKLLFGVFDYDRGPGLYNVGHVRFFTRTTAKKLFESAGYKVEKIDYGSSILGRWGLTRIWPTLFADQFIIVATPVPRVIPESEVSVKKSMISSSLCSTLTRILYERFLGKAEKKRKLTEKPCTCSEYINAFSKVFGNVNLDRDYFKTERNIQRHPFAVIITAVGLG
jgi:SAM-dependent methyltransferase